MIIQLTLESVNRIADKTYFEASILNIHGEEKILIKTCFQKITAALHLNPTSLMSPGNVFNFLGNYKNVPGKIFVDFYCKKNLSDTGVQLINKVSYLYFVG